MLADKLINTNEKFYEKVFAKEKSSDEENLKRHALMMKEVSDIYSPKGSKNKIPLKL